MYIIAGLGNPEAKYDNTRHNIGFHAVDVICRKYNINLGKLKFKALYGDGFIGGEKVIVAKPQTYMNLSGEAIRDMAAFYKVEPENIIVIFDDVSLEPGRMRIRAKGSAGGHNGIKSIIYQLNSEDFPRIKIGVGAPPHKDFDLADYVLGRFTPEEIETLEPVLLDAADAVESIIKNGIQTAMNKFNRKRD
ncbi:MAG: aminoacyl-tRNA hydrolase [Ruminococcaceae bacterium]|nr:aminoacyl-tRNA hydrolase [Oscillospiraceae bacterium]